MQRDLTIGAGARDAYVSRAFAYALDAARRVSLAGLVLTAALALAACTPHRAAQRAAPDPAAQVQPVFIAAQRPPERTGVLFGLPRTPRVHHFRADVSVPPTHQPGRIEWPEGLPDAATDFVVAATRLHTSRAAMLRDMRRTVPGGETLLFVHGYNTNLSEAMYRLAQIQTDFDISMPGLAFAWASAGDPRGYIYDRDSVLFARDALKTLLHDLTAGTGQRVLILAHSMGASLVMEALRQAALAGDHRLLARISGVVLMSPDLDPDLFERQAAVIGQLPQPFVIFIARQDRALTLAGLLTGRKPRLGVIDSENSVLNADVTVVDLTDLADGEGFDHSVAVTSPAAIRMINGIITETGRRGAAFVEEMALALPPATADMP